MIKKQILIMTAVLLACITAGAMAAYPELQASNTVHISISVDPEGAGSVERSERDVFINGTTTLTAKANAGYGFEGWYVEGELLSHDNPYQYKVGAEDVNIVAKFSELEASTLTLSVKPGCEEMGTVGVSPAGIVDGNQHKITTGEKVTLKATAARGYQFDRWEDGNGTTLSTSATYSFTLTESCTVYGVFKALENYRADLIAFPGAEGYGRYTTGGRMMDGRGSKVYYVTRLDDCPNDKLVEGTFRWAVKSGDDTPRTVLFKVAGTIYLTSNVDVKSNTTIAGQTAPGGGICLAGYRVKLGSNIIIRHIRFRAGDLPSKSMSPLGVENVQNVILDHCSLSWSMEENLTCYDNNYTTMQWCIFSEGLYNSKNAKGSRAYAAQWGGEHSTMHHCLLAHSHSRSPRFNGVRTENHDRKVDSEFFNNVIYNWGKKNSLYGGENYITASGIDPEGAEPHYDRVYMIGNYFRPGPATKNGVSGERYFVCPSGNIDHVGQWYLKDNKFELSSKWRGTGSVWDDAELEKVNADNYYGLSTNNKSRAIDFTTNSEEMLAKALLRELPEEYQSSGMTPESADEAYEKVVRQAGASLPRYDEVDARVLEEAAGIRDPKFGGDTHGKNKGSAEKDGIIDSPYDITLQEHDDFVAVDETTGQEINVTCYPRLQMDGYDCRVVDTDGDGMPDAYETEVGLNPNDASDGQQLTDSGYSNLEIFLNKVADGEIDAKQYTRHQPEETAQQRFNAIVGEGEQYQTIQAAVDAAPQDATPYYIFIKAGTYEGHVQVDRQNVHLTGQSKQNTIISWDKLASEGGVDKTATVNVTASDVSFDNLTLRNTRTNQGQALALYTKADRIIVTNCNLEGWQDTYRTGKTGQRHLVRNCKISGTTDFIYGDGEVYFDSDTLHVVRTSNVIVAPNHQKPVYGYVFRNTVITADKVGTKTHLGRPWHDTPMVAYIDTRLSEGVSISEEGWIDMDGLPIRMAEYNTMDANGNAVDLSKRKTTFTSDAGKTATSQAVLSLKEADGCKLDYMLRGNDEWDADWQAFILPAPSISVNGNTVSWSDHTGYAQSYLVIVDGKSSVTTDTSVDAAGKLVTVQCISAYGVCGEMASSAHPTAIHMEKTGVDIVSRQFFTADGCQVYRLQHGLTMIRETLADGTSRVTKVVSI